MLLLDTLYAARAPVTKRTMVNRAHSVAPVRAATDIDTNFWVVILWDMDKPLVDRLADRPRT